MFYQALKTKHSLQVIVELVVFKRWRSKELLFVILGFFWSPVQACEVYFGTWFINACQNFEVHALNIYIFKKLYIYIKKNIYIYIFKNYIYKYIYFF